MVFFGSVRILNAIAKSWCGQFGSMVVMCAKYSRWWKMKIQMRR